MASHELNQAAWRRDRNIRDQFGRLWLVSFETGPDGQGGSNMPTGEIRPAGWRDPLATPQEYLTIPNGEFGEPDRNRISCDLRPWVKKQRDAEAEWKKRLYTLGQKHYKSAFDPKTAEEDDFLMSVDGVGPKPWPPSSAIVRALQGDKAMLGLAPLSKEDRVLLGVETEEDLGFAALPTVAEPNPSLPAPATVVQRTAPAPVLTYPQFVKQMHAAGIHDPKEIGAHWQVYKAEQAKV